MPKPDDSMRVQIRRRMPAPREIVWDAWTNAESFRHWMCPGDVVSAEATLDVRVGGAFRIVMKSKTAEHVHTGSYQIVDPPVKLVFTWMANNHPPTLVTVEFLDLGAESELRITHEKFTIPDIAKRYESGWGTIAEKFAVYLAGGQGKNRANG